jgi:hypothetical protein
MNNNGHILLTISHRKLGENYVSKWYVARNAKGLNDAINEIAAPREESLQRRKSTRYR